MMRRLIDAAERLMLFIAVLIAVRYRRPSNANVRAADTGAAANRSLIARAKRYAVGAAALVVAAALGGFLVVAAGLIPIKASSGHWPITAWFLQFAMRRSIATHTIGMSAPSLDHPRLVTKGAGHYDLACRPCHGSPDSARPRITGAMTPHPPDLTSSIPAYEPEGLFYVVKHGVKFTGMPAWPALQRDDEVWAMVAFLQILPRLDRPAYRELIAAGTADTTAGAPIENFLPPRQVPEAITDSCARCHGMAGLGRGAGAFPRLAGQRPEYLEASLQAYASRERHSGIMEPIAAALDTVQIGEIARYYAGLNISNVISDVAGEANDVTTARIEQGELIATRGLPDQDVPPCGKCHSQGAEPRNVHYPRLSGQYADYLELQLQLFKAGIRGGTAYQRIMEEVASQLTPEQMRAVAAYFASDRAAGDRPAP